MKRVYLTLCLIIMIVLSVNCTTAFAADWYYVGTSDDGHESVYIDNASVLKDNRIAFIWEKTVMSDESYYVTRTCYTRHPKTFTLLAMVTYDAQGRVVSSEEVPYYLQTSHQIVPGTMGETIWYYIWPN